MLYNFCGSENRCKHTHCSPFMPVKVPTGPHQVDPQGPALPSVPPARLSGLVMPVLFFRRCFLRLAWGDGGGSSLGLVAPAPPPVVALGPPAVASPVPLAERRQTKNTRRYEFPQCPQSSQCSFVFLFTDTSEMSSETEWSSISLSQSVRRVCVCVCVCVCLYVCAVCVHVVVVYGGGMCVGSWFVWGVYVMWVYDGCIWCVGGMCICVHVVCIWCMPCMCVHGVYVCVHGVCVCVCVYGVYCVYTVCTACMCHWRQWKMRADKS